MSWAKIKHHYFMNHNVQDKEKSAKYPMLPPSGKPITIDRCENGKNYLLRISVISFMS